MFMEMMEVENEREEDIGKYINYIDKKVMFKGDESIGEKKGEKKIEKVKKGKEIIGYEYMK